jgi:hypothetical protein
MSKARRSAALGLLLAAVFFWGVIRLFNRQFASGELYPEFSSLRTDRMGTKLLFDSLGKLPGMAVERNFLPMDFLPRGGIALVLLGVSPAQVNWEPLFLRSVEQSAASGNRVIVSLYVDPDKRRLTQENLDRRDEPASAVPQKKSKQAPGPPPLRSLWKVNLKIDSDPAKPHPLYFEQAEGWTVHDREAAKILAMERAFGKGSVVLLAESADFTNASTVALNRLEKVTAWLGPLPRVVFDEQHLGVAESGSVVGMARQFRLTGLALGLALCAAIFIWKNASAFPPPVPSPRSERFSGRTSYSGLLTLLKRHIPPAELAGVCWREWLSTNGNQASPELRKRAEAILAGAAGGPLEATREIRSLLDAKGNL